MTIVQTEKKELYFFVGHAFHKSTFIIASSSILLLISNFFLSYFSQKDVYLFKVNNENTRAMCQVCSKLAIKTPKHLQWSSSGVFIGNFKQIHTSFYFFHCWLWTRKYRLRWLNVQPKRFSIFLPLLDLASSYVSSCYSIFFYFLWHFEKGLTILNFKEMARWGTVFQLSQIV